MGLLDELLDAAGRAGLLNVQSAPPYIPPEAQKPQGNWQAQPAPDGRRWGFRQPPSGRNAWYPPDNEQSPDRSPYFMQMPTVPERAYHPVLPYELSEQNDRDYQDWKRRGWLPEQRRAAEEFQRPKRLEDIFSSDRYTREAMRQMAPWLGMP